jgi:glycosyltransferase involved in cell wall biosynthesis
VDARPLRIALVGTRGVPAQYGGFETAVEEVGRRLAARGHDVTVYCRHSGDGEPPREHLGMTLVHLPAARRKALETLSHTGASVAHLVARRRPDVALVFNAANAPFLPALRGRGVPVATHVDGLEWQRAKWGRSGRAYYRAAESLAVRWSDALIADARGIAAYYRDEFGVATDEIAYGAPVLKDLPSDRLAELGLTSRGFHVVVARFEPENHVDVAVEGYSRSAATLPLVVVGSAPYSDDYTRRVADVAAGDPRIRLLGPVWDQDQLDQLYAHALTYVHGHSVGGTNPSLLRAMGAGTAVVAYDVGFNREVLDEDGWYFADAAELADRLVAAEADPEGVVATGQRHQQRAEACYRWDDVADRYEDLCRRLAGGASQRGTATGRRRGQAAGTA